MKAIRISAVLLTLLAGACATGPSEEELAAQQAAAQAAEHSAADAALEAQRVEQEQARVEAERQQQAETARRQQQSAAPSVEQRAQAVARQQERIAELREQIAVNQLETTNLEAANATLVEAIAAAEELVATLTGEQEKYTDTGTTTEPLSKERIAELTAQLERLQSQAAALTQQP